MSLLACQLIQRGMIQLCIFFNLRAHAEQSGTDFVVLARLSEFELRGLAATFPSFSPFILVVHLPTLQSQQRMTTLAETRTLLTGKKNNN